MKALLRFIFISLFFYSHTLWGEELKIGVAVGLTGPAAAFGEAERNGFTLATEELNADGGIKGRAVKLLVEDTQSTNTGTVTALTKLLQVSNPFILGPTWADSYAGALPVAQRRKALLLTPSCSISVAKKTSVEFPLLFSTWYSLEEETAKLLQGIRMDNIKSISLVFDEDPYFQKMLSLISEGANSHGLSVTHSFSTPLSATDFRSILSKIKGSNSEAVIAGFASDASLLSFLKQRIEILPKVRLFGQHDFVGYVRQGAYQSLFTDTKIVVPIAPSGTFRTAYKKRFGVEPILSASNAYDAAKILFHALSVAPHESEEIARHLRSEKFSTITFGQVKFNVLGAIDGGNYEIKAAKEFFENEG